MNRKVFLFLALCTTSTIAHAQTRTPEELLREGVQLRQTGDELGALERFREAHRIAPNAVTFAQIAATEQALGRWILAEQHMRQALADREHPYIQRNRAVLESAYETISRHVGQLLLTSNVANAEIRIDGELVAVPSPNEPLRLLVGSHRLEARAPGRYPILRTIEISAGTPTREELELHEERSVTTTPPPSNTPPAPILPLYVVIPPSVREVVERGPRALSWVFWSGGVVFLAGGLTSHILRENAAVTYNNECIGTQDPRDVCVTLRSNGIIETVFALTGYIGAAGLLTVGTIDAVLPRRRVVRNAVLPNAAGVRWILQF